MGISRIVVLIAFFNFTKMYVPTKKRFQVFYNMLTILVLLLSLFQNTYKENGRLTIEVENIGQEEGMVWLGIYRSEDEFLIKEKCLLLGKEVLNTGNMTFQVDSLPYGDYAFALFHDTNNNGVLDQNLIGIPSEPYAFSKIPASRFRLPTFNEIKFPLQEDNKIIKTRLKKWWQSD